VKKRGKAAEATESPRGRRPRRGSTTTVEAPAPPVRAGEFVEAPSPQAERPRPRPVIAPSILSADFSRLGEELAIVDPARDWVHCDVMDQHFVPNLTFGPIVLAGVRALTDAFLDVHLMIEHPERLLGEFRRAGADQITVHLEACSDPRKVLGQIRALEARAGLALKPGTPFDATAGLLSELDLLLVMTVEPGYGGQAFMPEMLDKVRAAADARRKGGHGYRIQVDGGIAPDTARECHGAGADVFVAGNAVYRHSDPREALEELRASVTG
jgi:ribulose-phosphate 3-epimerase